MDVDAIAGAVRGVLTGTLGTVRTVPSGRFAQKVHADVSEPEAWVRGRSGAAGALQAQCDVQIGAARRTGWIGPSTANLGVWIVPLDVLLFYAALPFADLAPARRYDIRAQAAEDTVLASLALCWPGNLTQDTLSAPTGIVSGVLHPRGEPTVEREEWTDTIGLYWVRVPFDAWVVETQAVT